MWSSISARDYEYRRVVMHGHYLHERETLVQAVTDSAPVSSGHDAIPDQRWSNEVLVNRGFVPPSHR
jgi:surfeit locus 1 family protein